MKKLLFMVFPVVLLTNCSNPELDKAKEKQKEAPDKIYPLNDVLKRIDKEMDSAEKELIDDILKEQKWIK